jgi:hypothetical protein
LRLIRPVNPFGVITKRAVAAAAAITVDLDIAITMVSDWLVDPSPALKGLSGAIPTFLGTNFCFALDHWQLQDDH